MVLLIITPDEMLEKGLRYANLHNSNVSRRKKIERFGSWFGSSPAVLAQIWEDLQTVLDGGIETHNVKLFFMSMHYVRAYPVESILCGIFGIKTETTACKWVWYFLRKIQELKSFKVS